MFIRDSRRSYRTYTYNRLMFIRDSRRSYRTYTYTELILITYLCPFGTPVGVTELVLILLFRGTRRYHRDITERILVLRNLFLYGSTRKYYLFKCPKRRTLVLISNLSYTHTGVPVGTTEFILIWSLYRDTRRYYITFYLYKSTCRYYITDSLYRGTHRYYWNYTYFSDTGVPISTTGLILTLPIR